MGKTMPQVALDTPLYEVLGAKSAFLRRLEQLGIKNIRDLLWHFPSRYEDFSKIYSIADLEPGQQATVQGIIEEVHASQSWRRHMSIVEAMIADESGVIRAIWFNQPYVANILKVGRRANFAGKVSLADDGERYLSHPAYEVLRGNEAAAPRETTHTARLVPVYPETRGLTSRGLRFIMQSIIKRALPLKEWIPQPTLAKLNFPEINQAIRTIHFPKQLADAAAAQKRFSFEDLFLLQIVNLKQKLKLAEEKAPVITADIEKVKTILAALPFELTVSQKKSLWEIMKDLAKPRPMNRLLQGDVGSGKTVVAAVAAMTTAENGCQTAFMAPTEILARQHFETMKELLARMPAEYQPAIGLVTGSGATVFYENDVAAPVTKPEMSKKVAAGEIAIVFGTHALIEKTVAFKNLGLVIIDEQHRFGVRQRAELAKKKGGFIPHFLSMSATPIPRTLMLTVFGDLDLSLITELPGGRKPIETKIVLPIGRQATYAFVKREIGEGRQVFVICPRIEKSEAQNNGQPDTVAKIDKRTIANLEMKSVKEEYEKLRTKIFPDLKIAMLHGQMKGKEKEDVMKKFKAREFDIMVATSVVEVGVDVPNASIMMIEGAERFGLAQLYQFRGRVGRGEYQSYCFLMADSDAKAANARLKAILEAKNGFELAEKDLALRGPGQFFGEIQTGLPDVAMGALQDPELVKASREAALVLVQSDPSLKTYLPLKAKLAEFQKDIHLE
ncbi:MAG: ATP-dependent DNA helicase RecG [Minisyncoccia bacterium]|jgi:ATP-dependent DNA helicase RecG